MRKLQRLIVNIYRLIGLLSIPALTVVTTISMANLFTAGNAAHWDNVSILWAWIYAGAIETNVVRLFTEKRRASLLLGLGLGIVTCIALQFEGMQQTNILHWDNGTVKMLLPYIIGLRSILVYVLIAYEGRRLVSSAEPEQSTIAQPGKLSTLKDALLDRAIAQVSQSAQSSAPSEQSTTAQSSAPSASPEQRMEQPIEHAAQRIEQSEQMIKQSIEQPIEHDTGEHEAVKQPAQLRAVPDARERVRTALLSNPGVSDRELARIAQLGSGNTAKRHREAIEQEQAS